MTSPLTNARFPPLVMVAHGPEVFDHGDVERFLGILEPSRTIVAGVMARTAAEESGLPVEFDGRPPSQVIRDLKGAVFLANRGKTPQSGRIFGDIISSRLGRRGLVHLECSDARVYCWNGGDSVLAAGIAARTGYSVETAESTPRQLSPVREIRGCIPGEPVYVNGIVIGKATSRTVVLNDIGGRIEPVSGLSPKYHGLEKLRKTGGIDIASAWCKSGTVRKAAARAGTRATQYGRIVVIDHCGHGIYTRLGGDCCGVVAIGDDTTAVCGHICLHRGIPVLGITDDDADVILPSAFAPESVILDTRPERDDDIGAEIAASVPEGPGCWDDFVKDVIARFSGRAVVVLDLREAIP